MTSRRIASIPSSRPITNSGCGRRAGVLEDEGDRLVALPGDAPAGPRELALLEVADRVGGEQPVALEEGAQQRPIGGRPGDDRVAPADRDGRHQAAITADRRSTRRVAGADARRRVAAQPRPGPVDRVAQAGLERRRGRRPPR